MFMQVLAGASCRESFESDGSLSAEDQTVLSCPSGWPVPEFRPD